jgi:hypothetical protein
MGEIVCADRAVLSQAGQRTTAERTGADAADLFFHRRVRQIEPLLQISDVAMLPDLLHGKKRGCGATERIWGKPR